VTLGDTFFRVTGSGAARLDVSDRPLLRVTGSDRVRFLNGMVTNDVAALEPGSLCYAALLDRKGRLQADLYVMALEEGLLVDPAPGTAATVAEAMTKHVIADDVEIGSEPCERLAVEGPETHACFARLGLAVPDADRVIESSWEGERLRIVGRGLLGPEGVQSFGEAGLLARLERSLELPLLTGEQVDVLCVEGFLPRYGIDITDRSFVAEARLDHTVSTTKGCYIGQEIEARIRSRGQVKRLLVKLGTDRAVRAGDPISVEGVRVGEVTSAAVSPVSGPLALGYVRTAQARPGTEVQAGESPGVVIGPPLEGEGAASPASR
jgi:folate-binding protein YgfZ